MTIGVPEEIQAILDNMDPKYREAYERGFNDAKELILERIKELEAYTTSTATSEI